ncbi:hypothetical protein HLI_07590 [Halobacillus litoralis]|uniref:Uncharacterized protein n=1 Tax=Halobacillus litoralis TaxID=45668 RepID=A0A410MBR7_9BACI|nr:hypothetical protein HLI_07590 [Halobacillus litoralis]
MKFFYMRYVDSPYHYQGNNSSRKWEKLSNVEEGYWFLSMKLHKMGILKRGKNRGKKGMT